MKKLLFLLTCFTAAQNLHAQTTPAAKPKLSAATHMYLYKQQTLNHGKATPMPEYVYKLDASSNVYVSAMMQVQPGFNPAALYALGAKVGTRAGNIWTVQVPLAQMSAFTQLSGIAYIDMDRPAAPALDTARRLTRTDSVQNGYGLPQPYSGAGTVVGIIDAGFDYTHPTYYDTAYSRYRVKRVWEEKNTLGTPPAGYPYGTEFSDSASILARGRDITTGTHGTHVGGIAGGSGAGGPGGNNSRFRGMAYASDLVFVGIYPTSAYWLNTGMTDMLDGINYVFDYATSVGKPAVANLSWGCPLGPHDGSSLFSQACNNITGPGKIFVLSGGNNGENRIHLKKAFTPTDTVVNTFTTFSTGLPEKKNWVDIWGDTSKTFCLQLNLYSATTHVDSSVVICLDDTTHMVHLIGASGDTCFVTVTTVLSEFNQKPHMLLEFYSRVNDRVGISVRGNSGSIDMWQGLVLNTTGYYGTFTKYSYAWAVNGDTQGTISDMVTTTSAIAVGAYNSKTSFVNVSGTSLSYTGYVKGNIASFSSRGPTADGRTKPNITGPGLALASSVSSVDPTYASGGSNYNSVVSEFVSPLNGETYAYAMAAGTSMSGPAVSGIVALLLQANPTLDPTQVMNILYQTAIKDSYTGVIGPHGSNTWGFGKVNAYRAMQQVLGINGIYHQPGATLECLLYPNPTLGQYAIDYVSAQADRLSLTVTTLAGAQVLNETWAVKPGQNRHSIDLSNFPAGVYITQLSGTQGQATVKIIKQ